MKRLIATFFITLLLVMGCSNNNSESQPFSSTSDLSSGEIVDSKSLRFYYPWINSLTENNVEAIYSVNYAQGIPFLANFNEWNVASKEEIKQTIDYLKTATVSQSAYRPQTPGEVPNEIVINTKNGESFSIKVFENVVKSSIENNVSYVLGKSLPSFTTFYAYALNSESTNFTVTDIENENDVTNQFTLSGIGKMLFTSLGDVEFFAVMNEYNRYKFENGFGYLIFQDERTFTIDDRELGHGAYQIINDVTFNSLKKSR